jgi:endo-1,4-beta-xylanase
VHALDRRDFLAGMTATTLAAGRPVAARAGRVPYGAAVNHYVLPTDTAYRAALARYCDVVVAEGAMKWAAIRPQPEAWDFAAADALVAFARGHGLVVRGHTLTWCAANPRWVDALTGHGRVEAELVRHITRTVGRYQDTIRDWDVVNEPIAEQPATARDLRPGVWLAQLGPRYLDIAFRAAADVDRTGRRVLNEYGIESDRAQDRLKREAFRRLIFALKDRGVPLTAVGLQAHIRGDLAIDTAGVSAFCAEMTRAGLEVLVTELDVIDHTLPQEAVARDAAAAALVDAFLGAVFAGCRPALVCTWGITDRYTWVPTWFKRADGTPNRPLPFDANLEPKPMWRVLQRYCRPD